MHGEVPKDAGEAAIYWLNRYDRQPTEAARGIRELVARSPERVATTLLQLFEKEGWGGATSFLAKLLSSQAATAARVCNPAASLSGSVILAKMLMQHEPSFDARLAKSLTNGDHLSESARHRGFAILEKLSDGGRLIPILIQFLRDPDSRVRSKAALMFGRIAISRGIVDRLMGDANPRVRANFIEGLWSRQAAESRPFFERALKDVDHRVVGNAVVGLYRAGEIGAVVSHMSRMARRPEAPFRAAAAWAMGQTGEDHYTGVLGHMLHDSDPLVRRSALRALRKINLARAAS